MARWIGWVLVGCAACGGDEPYPPEPPDAGPCAWEAAPQLQAGFDLAAEGPIGADDVVPYGRPPQGGAPYAPFQVRAHVAWEGDALPRWLVRGSAVERSTGAPIGAAEQPQTFFCSNTGPHEGWLFGGEVHLRFPDDTLEALEGRVIDVSFALVLGDGEEVEATGGGTLTWTLGYRPDDDTGAP